MTTNHSSPCPCCGYEEPHLPWYVDEEKSEVLFPDLEYSPARVHHRYKDIYYSVPYHKEWRFLPSELLFRAWPPNQTLAVEHLSLFFQAVMGPSDMLTDAASQFLRTFTWRGRPENEQIAAMAVALDHILASNGGVKGTITVARTDTGYPDAKSPVYVRFQKGVGTTSVDVPRYPDDERPEARDASLDLGLLRSARRIQEVASSPPFEIRLTLESYRVGGDLGIGLEINEETTIDEIYRNNR